MRALLKNDTIIQYNNLVGAPNCRHAMRDHDQSPTVAERSHGLLNRVLRNTVEITRRLVQDQQLRVCQNCTRNGEALLLTPGKPRPTIAKKRLVSFWQAVDEFRARSQLGGPAHFRGGHRPVETEGDISFHCVIKKKNALNSPRLTSAPTIGLVLAHVDIVHQDCACLRVVKSPKK